MGATAPYSGSYGGVQNTVVKIRIVSEFLPENEHNYSN